MVEGKEDNTQNNAPKQIVTGIMSTSLVTMSYRNNIFEIAKKMKSCRVSAIFLTDSRKVSSDSTLENGSNIVGMVTQTDLVNEVCATNINASMVTAESIMSPIITINEDANIEEAARLMTERRIRHLGVSQRDNPDIILGIITGTDLAKYLKSKLMDQNQQRSVHLTEELALADALSVPDQLPSGNQDIEC